jgi:aldehyde dehydrogenase (NAD+)
MTSNSTPTRSAVREEAERIFILQKANQQRVADSTARDRKQKLNRMHSAVLQYRTEIREALYKDFRKPPSEVDIVEIFPVTADIKHTQRHLAKWMRPKKVATPISLIGARSYIHYEPKGVVLIISPWNIPFGLTFGPLISAIAAGNCVILKPSEHTPHISSLMKKIIHELFDESEVALMEGDIDVSTELLKLPFNHIFFTGAPEIGKIVMKAAAEHLASVTLELGGKSPTVVDETAKLKDAAHRISFGKWLNNGQVCIAPDHVFVHASVKDEFLVKVKNTLRSFYGEDAALSDSYNRIVNQNHFRRIKRYFEDALAKGARVEYGGRTDPSQDYIGPTIMTNIPENSDLAEKEIFGPILPVYTYTNLQEVINVINSGEKPLALYIFSKSRKNVRRIINNTRAGGTCINHCGLHFYNNNLPFGGTNNSGIGKGNGFYGFETFSNPRAVLNQWSPFNGLDLMTPPYTVFKQKLIDFTIKWF